MPPISPTSLDAVSAQILDAATRRFLHYGYTKTTMSEIAQDCAMSTGNLYRYFPSKLDIAETFVGVLRQQHIAELQEIADASDTPQEIKLRRFFQTKLQLSYERFHNNPKAFELSSALLTERPNAAQEWVEAETDVLSQILANFDFCDDGANAMAHVLQDIAYKFTSPSVFHAGERKDLAAELDLIIDLVLDGFAWRRAGPGR